MPPASENAGSDAPDDGAWITEAITPSLLQLTRVVTRVFSGQTRYQRVEVYDTAPFGRLLLLDGKTQSTEADEYVYHEALVHPAMLAHPDPRRIFIGGGGEGATLREVLTHRSVARAVMVDLDGEVVALCREYLPQWHQGAFDDPRTELLHEDARAYLEREQEPFDVMVLDLVDPMEAGLAYKLYTQEFYRLASSRLGPQGTLVVQSGPAISGMMVPGSTTAQGETTPGVLTDLARGFTALCHTLATVFPMVVGYSAVVPAFGGAWSFVLASKGTDDPSAWPPEEVDRRITARIGRELRFYDGVTHRGLFSLPKPLREALAREEWVVTEDRPLMVP